MDTTAGLLAVAVLVALNGWFVASEYALVTIRPTRVQQLLREGRGGASHLKHAIDHLDADLASREEAVSRLTPVKNGYRRFRATDNLLAFLDGL